MAVLDHTFLHTPSFLSRMGSSIATAFEAYARARSRTAEFEFYNALSDAELAARGLRREDIARHIFRDYLI